MSVKDKKKKEKKRQEALQKYGEDISKRTKGVSRKEWIKAREQEKATGNLPTQIRARQAQAKRSQFISPLASNLSPQARQQADNIIQQLVPKSPFQTPTNASFAPRPQLSPQEKIKADSIIAQMGQSQFGNLNLSKPAPITYAPQEKEAPKQSFMQKIGSFIGKSPAIQSIQQKSLKPVGEALRNSFTPNESAKEGESTADYVARNMFQVAGLFGPSDLGTGAVSLSKEIAKSKSSDFIKSILKGKLKDETVERITPILTKSKDVKEIQGILKGAEVSVPVVQKKAIADLVVGKPTAKQAPTAPKMTSKPVKAESKVSVLKTANKLPKPEVDDIAKYVKNKSTKFRVADEGDDLVSKAQKMKSEGKSFDEFVKAQGKPILHGTNKRFNEFDLSKRGINEKDIPSRNSFFFTDSMETAKSYGKNIQERYGKFDKPITIDAEGKMYGDMRDEMYDAVMKAKKEGNDAIIIKNLSDRKDWGNYEPATHYAVLDINKLKTKSQLLDIWNKANKGDDLISEARKFKSAEELRELGGGKLNEKFREIGVRYQSDYDKWWKENMGDKVTDSYQMSHRPTRTGATADNVSQEVSDMGLPDFYEHPEYYHFGGKEYDESVQALRKIKGKPDAEITIYRASPKGELRSGDWVTLSKEKARLESLTEKTSVHSFKVKVKDVEFAGDDITEFGYWGKGISQEKFRVKDDLAKVGIKITDDQEQQIIKLNKSMFGDENIKITEQILTPQGQKALGSYRDGLIKIVKGEADIKDTYYHESFHKYLDVLTTADEQIDLLREARSVSGIKDIAEVEEWLSESFIKYAKNREGVTGKLKAQFDNILERVKSYFGNEDKIKKAYSELLSGKKKAAKTPIEILQNEGNLSQTGIPKVLAKKTTQQEVQQSLRKDNITKNLSSGNVNDYSKAKKSIENTWRTAIREWGQDKLIRVKKLIDSGDIKVDENSNPYLKESLMHGRISTRLDSIKHQITEIDKSISVNEKIFNDKALQKDIDRYLIAKHAPERNKALGEKAAGMTDNEASQILAELGANPKRLKVIEEIGNKISTMNKQTLEILKDGGVIDDELFTTLTTKYKNHIPLNRIMDETDDISEYLTGGRGINVKSTGIKRAKGSEREVSDILTNVTANLEQAVVRSEKNRVAQSVLKLARDNKMVGGLFEEIKPRAIGESFDGKPLLERINDPLVMTIRENGKPVYLKINDKNLAEALQGVNIEQLGTTMRTIGWFTRMYSGLMTRFNPEFAFSNVIRDMQENMVYASSKEKMGITGALKIPTKTVGSTKNIVDFMRGKKTAGSNLYKQMLEDGGSTGGMSISTKKQLELDINKIRKLNRSNPRKAAEMVINGIDNWNQIFEDANRLSAYKVALDRGYSREMAASIAKESTINFNRKGTAGSFINSLYMFSNASIQGSTKMLQALKNPKTAVATATAVGIPVVLANQWNDSVDPQWRDKVSEWDRQSNLVVMLPSENGDANYVTIPVGWGIKPIMAAVNSFYDISQGTGKGLAKEGGKILTSIIEGYNPAGGTDLISAITPTPLDTPSEISRNKSWSGSMIRPDWKEGLPKTEQNFDSLKDKATGRGAINTAEFIRDKTGVELNPQAMVYALEAYIGGAGKTVTKTGNFLTSLFKGEDLAPQETPVVSRFYKEKPAEELQTRAERNAKNEFFKSLKKYETGSDEQKKAIQEYVISKPEEERQGLLFQIRDLGFDTKGITSSTDAYNIKPTYEKINKLFESGKTSEAYKEIDKLSASDKEAFNRMKSEKKPSWYKPKEVKENPQKQTFEKAYELQLQGKYKEADDLVKNMTDEEFEDYKKARAAKRASNSTTMKARLAEDPKLAVEFVRSQPKKEQERLINLLTDEQYARYQEGK